MTDAELLAIIAQAEREGWTELDLSGNDLEELSSEIGRLQSLERLILGKWDDDEKRGEGNRLTAIPQEIFQLTNLKELYIPFNQITAIPDAILNLASLTTLDLSWNEIKAIPEAITQLVNLTTLDLSINKITAIPDSIANLVNLTELHLDNNKITTIPDSFANLVNLTTLFLFNNKITTIPDSFANLINLTELHLDNNQITAIPDAITNLANLTTLSLSGNQITAIPDAITNLANLTTLSLSRNQIKAISDAITNLANLTTLFLFNNQITAIPDAIANLVNLTALFLFNNQITAIPDAIANLANLTTLSLGGNQITAIPDAIANLANLTTLLLDNNQITAMPDAISLTNLTKLDLSSNQITAIPDAISNLANLTELSLSNNQITEIPDVIAQLNLTSLSLHSNQITQIPDVLENLPKLKKLDLRRNPLPISPEILGVQELYKDPGAVKDIFNYLRQLRSGEVRPLNEAKLILVGQGSVGKTSLIKKLVHNRYNPNEQQTDGLNVEPWDIQVNSKDIRLNVWDFGGQEIYHATHQFFLTKRSLYLLVCNCRTSEEENRIEYWLKLIESFGDKSPVIIVGNKKDEQPLDINRKALREKYPNIQAIIETSCQDNIGIDELRTAILEQVANLKEVYDLLPLSWFEVKQQLEAMTEDFISYNRYIGICHENKIPEENNQEQLIDLLHRLGLVLNFRDHPILKGTNVLKPEWVTEGIYKLLSDDILKTENKGIFTLVDLNRILDLDRYPRDRHHYLIELMQEFKLYFTIDCHPPKFLIPAILPKDEPQNTRLPDDILEFQYHYRILPNSIISRFIVNTSDYIHNQTYWRSGVMLSYPESGEVYNIARIKADTEDKKIFIAISGRKETRREFLAIIRKELNKIHKNFSNLDITEWVTIPEHPKIEPLNYQDLLIAEDVGETETFVPQLRRRVKINLLLDGYIDKNVRRQEANVIVNNINNDLRGANIGNMANTMSDDARLSASQFTQSRDADIEDAQ
ncbi:leucine-rich repeat domain-containing protein [Pseudanabaena mucicola]|uniref:non-specific serine/threonine protein kinase n=1 Tax=Pseudanabaena mucicola FACHB-723 TaxID=2692860 RepID=A0ABR8A0B5_9CYAN|nr:leucine-rich repeat domain-containing protein [Pseudanabaena mucicola]MBD2189681.1 leucine-rich repeat domain-containing protein [Pseudanabaena mucicola FACHB-723]